MGSGSYEATDEFVVSCCACVVRTTPLLCFLLGHMALVETQQRARLRAANAVIFIRFAHVFLLYYIWYLNKSY